MIRLLHKEKYLPEFIINKVLKIESHLDVDRMTLSYHLNEHINNTDYKHDYNEDDIKNCLKTLLNNPIEPFEVEFDTLTNYVNKWVVRIPFKDNKDMSISIRGYKIITAWVNSSDDKHFTLDLSKYDDKIY